jgi:hypothetical protein
VTEIGLPSKENREHSQKAWHWDEKASNRDENIDYGFVSCCVAFLILINSDKHFYSGVVSVKVSNFRPFELKVLKFLMIEVVVFNFAFSQFQVVVAAHFLLKNLVPRTVEVTFGWIVVVLQIKLVVVIN